MIRMEKEGENLREERLLGQYAAKRRCLEEQLPHRRERGTPGAVNVAVDHVRFVELEDVSIGGATRRTHVVLGSSGKVCRHLHAPQMIPIPALVASQHLAASGLATQAKLALLALRGFARALEIRDRRANGRDDDLERGDGVVDGDGVRPGARPRTNQKFSKLLRPRRSRRNRRREFDPLLALQRQRISRRLYLHEI